MSKPLISVILPTYNGNPTWLKETIDSVLVQSYTNFELIIINDASTNNVETQIKETVLLDSRIHYLKNDINLERSASKNRGICNSRWEYIAFIDDDDIWCDPDKLKKQVDFLEMNREYWLCWTDLVYIDENGSKQYEVKTKKSNDLIKNTLLWSNQFAHSSIMIRKEVLDQSWLFNIHLSLAEDYDLWMRIWIYSKLSNLDFFGIYYRNRSNNTSSRNSLKIEIIALWRSLQYIQYYPNRLKGVIFHLIAIFVPKNIIKYLIRYRASFSQKNQL